MTQLTLRGFEPELEKALRRLARDENISLNQAALRLLRRGAGVAAPSHAPIGAALDAFVGTLSADDAQAVDDAVRAADQVDLELQRQGPTRR